jgi:LlaJI restriction endonuclease
LKSLQLMEFSLLVDREPTFPLDDDIVAKLRKFEVIKKTNIDRIHFCGVIITRETVFALVPRNFKKSKRLTNLRISQIAALILRVLNKYNTFPTSALGGSFEPEDDKEGLGILSSILWLLNDYATHGLYTTSIKSREFNSGKVNWSRTISRETPYAGIGGSPIYMRLHSERLKFGEQSPVTLIHAEIIKEFDRAFCWVVTGDPAIRVASELDFVPQSSQHTVAKVYLLRKELASTYADREIRLLNTLINYLESKNQGTEGEYLIGVRTFQNVWEKMLRDTIPGVINVNASLPKPAVYLKGKEKPISTRGMITDIVSRNHNTISIIDAKYYRAESPEDSPGWADIVKQLFYAKALHQIFPDHKITNWFIFPGDHPAINEGPISNVAVINTEDGTPLEKEFPSIGCAYFCPMDVMQRYASSMKYSFSEIYPLYSKAIILEKHQCIETK